MTFITSTKRFRNKRLHFLKWKICYLKKPRLILMRNLLKLPSTQIYTSQSKLLLKRFLVRTGRNQEAQRNTQNSLCKSLLWMDPHKLQQKLRNPLSEDLSSSLRFVKRKIKSTSMSQNQNENLKRSKKLVKRQSAFKPRNTRKRKSML